MERLSHTHPDDTSELLSAYSDNAVDVVERRRAEEYLQQCAACVQELREFRMMKELLRELPYVQPPRSFTIDPATAPRPRWLLFPTLRLASLVAAVLLVMVLGVDGFNAGMSSSSAGSTSAQQSPEMQSRSVGTGAANDTGAFSMASAAASTGAAAEALPMASAAAAAAPAAGGAAAASAEAAMVQPEASPAVEGAATAAGGTSASEAASQAAAGAAPPPAPEPTTLAAGDAIAGYVDPSQPPETVNDAAAQSGTVGAANDAATQSGAAGGAAAASLKSEPPSEPDTVTLPNDATFSADDAGSSSFDTLRIVELVLGVVAVAFGIGAFVAWRRGL